MFSVSKTSLQGLVPKQVAVVVRCNHLRADFVSVAVHKGKFFKSSGVVGMAVRYVHVPDIGHCGLVFAESNRTLCPAVYEQMVFSLNNKKIVLKVLFYKCTSRSQEKKLKGAVVF